MRLIRSLCCSVMLLPVVAMAGGTSTLPNGYVPAPAGKGWSESPSVWREYDHAGRAVVRCLSGQQDKTFRNAPTGAQRSCKDSQRTFRGTTVANGTSRVEDGQGNHWDVHVSGKIERWTDANGNVTTCKYESGFKSCKFPEPSSIKV